jgi:hypothetical protein
MTDMRHHRGPAPEDEALFAPGQWPALLEAGRDLFWLLNRAYPKASANELVGNRRMQPCCGQFGQPHTGSLPKLVQLGRPDHCESDA